MYKLFACACRIVRNCKINDAHCLWHQSPPLFVLLGPSAAATWMISLSQVADCWLRERSAPASERASDVAHEHLKLKQIDYYKHCVLAAAAGRPAFAAAGAADRVWERVCVFFRDLKISDTQRTARHSFANSVTHNTERASGRHSVFCLTHAADRYEISSRTSARRARFIPGRLFIVYEILVLKKSWTTKMSFCYFACCLLLSLDKLTAFPYVNKIWPIRMSCNFIWADIQAGWVQLLNLYKSSAHKSLCKQPMAERLPIN